MPEPVTPDAEKRRLIAGSIGRLPGDPNIAAGDAPVRGRGGEELTVGKAVGATPQGQALADLAMRGGGPQISAGNPYAGAIDAAVQGAARENFYNKTGAQAGPFGLDRPMGSAAPAALADAMSNAIAYDKTMNQYGGGGGISNMGPMISAHQDMGSASGGPAGSNFGFARLKKMR